jgi:Family of unknown function (DUF6518)
MAGNPVSRPRARRRVTALVLGTAVTFGAVDQYIGSLFSPFLTAVSGMSAPWLLLPFAVGALQASRVRAAWLGLAATWLGIAGYVLMIDSPMEGVHLTLRILAASGSSQWPWFLGGLISGPLYGVLGHYWRARRSWLCAGLAAIPVILEPAVSRLGMRPAGYPPAALAEAAAGLVLAALFAYLITRARRAPIQAGLPENE